MKKQIYDEKNGLWYELHGDYYLPCLALPEEEQKPIGIWGQHHLQYIKQNKHIFYTELLTLGKLNGYLADIDRQAEEMLAELMKRLAEKEGVTEKLKADDQMQWVGRMNAVRETATEIVNNDLIFV